MQEALLQAIIDDPSDDLPRHAYADWLEENGEDARAEFIHVQCMLSRSMVLGDHAADCDCAFCGLRRRERELLEAHRSVWLADAPCRMDAWSLGGPPSDWVYGVRCQFRRGFVHTVKLPLAAWQEHGPALVRQQPIERVELSDKWPARGNDDTWYFRSDYAPGDTREAIPLVLCRHMAFWTEHGHPYYDTEKYARDALSQACLAWAKQPTPGTPMVKDGDTWRPALPGEATGAIFVDQTAQSVLSWSPS